LHNTKHNGNLLLVTALGGTQIRRLEQFVRLMLMVMLASRDAYYLDFNTAGYYSLVVDNTSALLF